MNAAALRQKMADIIAAIDSGEANPQKVQRALARAIDLLAKDIEGLAYAEKCRAVRESTDPKGAYDDMMKDLFKR